MRRPGYREALEAELEAAQRLVWMLVEQAGGRVEISRAVAQRFDPQQAELTTWTDAESGAYVHSTRGR